MKNKYYSELLLDIQPLVDSVDVYKFTQGHTSIKVDNVHPAMIEFLSKLGIRVSWVELFYRRPFNVSGIHVDNAGGDYTKLLWVYGGKDSTMKWFTEQISVEERKPLLTPIGTGFKGYQQHEVNIEFCTKISNPCLIQVGVPHQVVNKKESRYALCFVLTDNQDKRLTMAEAYSLLTEYIK